MRCRRKRVPQTVDDAGVLPPDDLVTVARVIRSHGLRGEVRVRAISGFEVRFAGFREVYAEQDDGGAIRLEVTAAKGCGDTVFMKFKGIDDRNAADALRGSTLAVRIGDLPELSPGCYYRSKLVGMEAVDSTGGRVGTVVRVDAYPANDVFVIETAEDELWVPAVRDFISAIDSGARLLTVLRIDELPRYPKQSG